MHQLGEAALFDPFPPGGRFDDREDRDDAHRAIGVSAVGLAVTGLVELAIGVLSGSVGLLGDALHNLSDVSTSAVVFIGFRLSRRPATASHPYGYERAEDLAGLGVALVVWASAVFAGVISVRKLTSHGTTSHLGLGIAAAMVGIIGNQLVARYKMRVGRRIQSTALIADAQHSWLDALSSAGAVAGLLGVGFGLPWADGVAGLVVTVFIVHVGYEITTDLVEHLMDGVDPAMLAAVQAAAEAVPSVEHAHTRARWMGRTLMVEIDGFVDPTISIGDAEAIGRAVEATVAEGVPQARTVLFRPLPAP